MIARICFDCELVNFNRSDDSEARFFQALRQPSTAGEQVNSCLPPVQIIRPTLIRLAHSVGSIPRWRFQDQTSAKFGRHPAK